MALPGKTFDIKTVAIIGAGPSGIAAAKYLAAEHYFAQISIFEQRSSVGGVWNRDSVSPPADRELFPSPIYDTLESNIPNVVMQHSDLPFPDGTPLLPNAETVLTYLNTYAKEVFHLVEFRKQVLDVREVVDEKRSIWEVQIQNLNTKEIEKKVFDAVVVANGRYNEPYIPDIAGLKLWKELYPDSVSHSKFYRDAEAFRNKKVIVVGFSSSGVDITSEIEHISSKPLLISKKSVSGLSPGSLGFADGRLMLPEIVSLDPQKRSVLFANGRTEEDIDNIIFCTGYSYLYPFLTSLSGFEHGLGKGNVETYKHIFYIANPTLAFIMLPLRAVAFPFAESQAAAVARVWSGRLDLPSTTEMKDWVEKTKEIRGTGKAFHKLSYPADADYMNEFHDWCSRSRGEGEGDVKGKKPPYWGARERWLRKNIHQIRRATEETGENRYLIKTVEDVDFIFPGGEETPRAG